MDDEVCLISRDYLGAKGLNGGRLIWRSTDGLSFNIDRTVRAFEELSEYVGEQALKNAKVHRGNIQGHLERPQLLMINGKPEYLYVATGVNKVLECGSASHVFKLKISTNNLNN